MSFISELAAKRQIFLDGLDANEGDINLGIFEDFYPDEAHFIYELLQNAEDAGATEVSFELHPHSCAYVHNGTRHFDEEDIKAITGIFNSSKKNNPDKIGKFGVGFKSVFVYTETPVVYSKNFSFRISHLVLPEEIKGKNGLGKKTRFEFNFNNPKKSASAAFVEIKSGLNSLHETTLLFLNNIGKITWRIAEEADKTISRIEHSECHVELKRSGMESNPSRCVYYLRFKRPVVGLEKQHVAIAFQLEFLTSAKDKVFNRKAPLSSQFQITSATPGKVSVFFPAEKETSGLRFHLHAPFVPELSRASIKDTPVNQTLYFQIAALTADSLHQIRDLGLLTGGFLAVLPNSQDQIPARYEHIRASVINVMNEKPLTPTQSGSHAPAKRLLQSKASMKELLLSEDIRLLIDVGSYDDWAIGAPQKNSNQDRFLSSLAIKEYGIEYLASFFSVEMRKWYSQPNEKFKNWFAAKSDNWHQQVYALLYREARAFHKEMQDYFVIRCERGGYWSSKYCYFHVEGKDYGHELFLVANEVYTAGKNKSEQEDSRKFLEAIGVRVVSETMYVEKVLERRYSLRNLAPRMIDLKRFIALVEVEPVTARLFTGYFIFKIPDGKWSTPSKIFIDYPFRVTGLCAWYSASGDNASRHALNEDYNNGDIEVERLAKFAEVVGAQVRLEVKKISCKHNPDAWNLFHLAPGGKRTAYEVDEDYDIDGIAVSLKHQSIEVSRLIWQTLMKSSQNWTVARYCKNRDQPYRRAPSHLAHYLKTSKWVPQEGGVFVKPSDASINKLPDGFPIDKGWAWLREIGFGENDEVIEQERHRQLEEQRKKQEIAKSLGFHDEKALQDAQQFARLTPEERQRFFAEQEKKKAIDLPDNSPKNPQQRAEHVGNQALDAPERTSEQRMRSVSTGKSAVTKEADQYLRQQYTNADGEMICQICRDELPFKLSDGSYYFEAVEFLRDLNNRHYQNHLALCPNHAAMFKFANGSPDNVLQRVMSLAGNELEIVLAGADERIYFTATHVGDLKAVIKVDQPGSGDGMGGGNFPEHPSNTLENAGRNDSGGAATLQLANIDLKSAERNCEPSPKRRHPDSGSNSQRSGPVQISAYMNDSGVWSLTPTNGPFEGQVVALAEGMNMRNVKVEGRTLVGAVKAVWGATVLVPEVYDHAETFRALSLNGHFEASEAANTKLWFDYDGLHDSVRHVVRGVQSVVAVGAAIFGKGLNVRA
jgi:hypothetical protein